MSKVIINPNTLVFRENMQNRIEEVARRFVDDNYSPIVTVGDMILDGHNRAAVAIERGHNIPAVCLAKAEYQYLVELGYDDMEISYAALTAADEIEAAMTYVDQFAGSNIFERGEEAYDKLAEMRG